MNILSPQAGKSLAALLFATLAALGMLVATFSAIALVGRFSVDAFYFFPIPGAMEIPVLVATFFIGCAWAFACHYTTRRVLRIVSIRELFPKVELGNSRTKPD
jgi:hypothetical protein